MTTYSQKDLEDILKMQSNQIQKEVMKIIEDERVYPEYQEFEQPAEAITQFKVRLKYLLDKLFEKKIEDRHVVDEDTGEPR